MSFDDVSYVSMERTWTPAITGLFESRYGRPAALYYPALFYDIGPETAAARVAFYDLSRCCGRCLLQHLQ